MDFADKIYNISAFKDLMHRKGLNMRFAWLLLCKVKLNFSRDIIMIDLLVRTMRKIVNEEVKLKTHNEQRVNPSQVLSPLKAPLNGASFFVANQLDQYKETLCFFMNAILKNKFCKYRPVFDETLLGLFLSRMRVVPFVSQVALKPE